MGWVPCLAFLLLFATANGDPPRVTSIDVFQTLGAREGSERGGTRINIYVKNFETQTTIGENGVEIPPVKAYFVNDKYSIIIDINTEAMSDTLVCGFTRAMPKDQWFYIMVEIDDYVLFCSNYWSHSSCRFATRSHKTPLLRNCYFGDQSSTTDQYYRRYSGKSGELITCEGEVYTTKYGSGNDTVDTDENGEDTVYRKMFSNGEPVELADGDVKYGMWLDDGNTGGVTGLFKGSIVGYYNISIILTKDYGRSSSEESMNKVSPKGEVYHLSSHAEINSVTPQSGGAEGGTLLKICGHDFDATNGEVEVKVGGVTCEQTESSTTGCVNCFTGPKPNAQEYYAAARGMYMESWFNSVAEDINNVKDLTSSDAGYTGRRILEESGFRFDDEMNDVDLHSAVFKGVVSIPSEGRYRFQVRGDDVCQLYIRCDGSKDLVNITAFTSHYEPKYDDAVQFSDWYNFEEGQECYFEAYVQDTGARSELYVALFKPETTLTNSQSPMVKNERQRINFNSPYDREIQLLSFTNMTDGTITPVREKQKIVVSDCSAGTCSFTLSFLGVHTESLITSLSRSQLETALQEISYLSAVVVTSEDGGYVVEFDNEGPQLLLQAHTDSGVTVTISRTVTGVSSFSEYSIIFGGRMIKDIPRVDEGHAKLTELLKETKKSICPSFILPNPNKNKVALVQDYEEPRVGWESGWRKTNIEPFCGGTSSYLPWYIYHSGRTQSTNSNERHEPFDLFDSSWLCLAHRGTMRNIMYIHGKFTYLDNGNQKTVTAVIWPEIKTSATHPWEESEDSWRYHCIDLKAMVKEHYPELNAGLINRIQLLRSGHADLYYVDSIVISSEQLVATTAKETELLNQRTRPAHADGEPMNILSVTHVDDNSFKIDAQPHRCGDDVPLIELVGVAKTATAADSLTQRDSNWPETASFNVERTKDAISEMSGTIDLSIPNGDGVTYTTLTDIDVQISAEDLTVLIETSVPGFGDATVVRHGDCARRDYDIEWKSNGGDKPQMTIDASKAVGHEELTVTLTTVQDGGILYDPIPGDMLRLPFDTPQVEVFVEGIPSSCLGDCSFVYDDALTPTVSSISTLSGTVGTEVALTITGTNLAPVTDTDTIITVAGAECTVTAESDNSITCDVTPALSGKHNVVISVGGKGYPTYSGSNVFEVTGTITGVNPDSNIYTTGGAELTITGTGFTSMSSFSIGSTKLSCSVTSAMSATCTAVAGTGTESVTGESNDIVMTTSATVTYTSTGVPQITTQTPATFYAAGGTLEFTGTNFGTIEGSVLIGTTECVVDSWSDTIVNCMVPSMPTGTYTVSLMLEYGMASGSSSITVSFEMTSFSPTQGSFGGGTVLTVNGNGFDGDAENYQVLIGKSPCTDVAIQSLTELTCTTGYLGARHIVTAASKYVDSSLSWSVHHLEIHAHDEVEWKWDLQMRPGSPYGIRIYFTDGLLYESGTERTAKQSFVHKFNTPGTYMIDSSLVDGDAWGTIRMTMKIEVVESLDLLPVSLTAYGQTADTNWSFSRRKRSVGTCTGIEQLEGCTPESGSPGLGFQPDVCMTAEVTDVSPTSGTTSTTITITGTGFTSEMCALTVTFGGDNGFGCLVTAASTTEIQCTPTVTEETLMNAVRPVKVYVKNIGNALSDSFRHRFGVAPSIDSINPTSGSVHGNSLVTITGSGFQFDYLVTIGALPCDITEQSFFEIKCRTRAQADGIYDISVAPSGFQPIVCNGGIACEFTYAAANSPEVTDVTPTEIAALDAVLTVTGTTFGDDVGAIQATLSASDTEVTCDDVTLISGGFTCKVASIAAGTYIFEVVTADGLASGSTHVYSKPTITTVTPSEGSKSGGTVITISGHGFGDDDTMVTVTIDGAACEIIPTVNNLQITCTTPSTTNTLPHEATLKVLRDGTTFTEQTFTYEEQASPSFTSITPATGSEDSMVTITGEKLDASTVVKIGGVVCDGMTFISETEITCSVGPISGGEYDVTGYKPSAGNVESTLKFTAEFAVSQVKTNGGSCLGGYGGGFTVDLVGVGFSENMEVRVCDNLCTIDPNLQSSTTQFSCILEREPLIVSSEFASRVRYNKVFSSVEELSILAVETHNSLLANNRPLGQVFKASLDVEANVIDLPTARALTENALKTPDDYQIIKSHVSDDDGDKISVWRPNCPHGYHGLGDILIIGDDEEPDVEEVWCVHQGLLKMTTVASTEAIWTTSESAGNKQMSLWGITDSPFFVVQDEYTAPDDDVIVYRLKTDAERTDIDADSTCPVTIDMIGIEMVTADEQCTYSLASTGSVTSFTPTKGGTAGGTTVTLHGSFADSGNKVSFNEISCEVVSESNTMITCETGATALAFKAKPDVYVPGSGFAIQKTEDTYEYIHYWSHQHTWGGIDPPVAGDFIVVSLGQTIILDQSTPILKFLLIDGGKVIFDPDKDGIELHAEYILILNGGILQIGTEDEPYPGKATVTLHGHVRSVEIPIYGVKSLGIRDGIIDMHGMPVGHTWTRLSETANEGATEIKLQDEVTWKAGDEIVLPTTGLRHTQEESETAIIQSVSGDGKTLTLQEPLKHTHISEQYDLEGDVSVEMRCEVGLLTRNIVFRGSNDDQWHDDIPECEAGFDTGEFTTQTCFSGRHGAEVGSDQFGAMMMIHPAKPNGREAKLRLSNVELTYVGQAFRLGRYPIHFHLVGDASDSYVKECAIHKTFNRAVTIHGTNYLHVDKNVVYNVMGGAIFIEDGIEMGNVIEYNLAVFVRQSTSLQNDDITPAAYWVTNPNNIITHNVAAGGTHFGFWYRMHEHPDGPSRDTSICQRNHPVAEFRNNTVHSQGWFGIWIFQIYHPKVGGGCLATEPEVQKFHSLTTWNCEKGSEAVSVGAVQFVDFTMINNEKAGIEYKIRHDDYLKKGQYGVINSTIVAHVNSASETRKRRATGDFHGTAVGMILPFSEGFDVRDTTFVNFDHDTTAAIGVTKIDGKCTVKCGGWSYHFYQTNMLNSPNRIKFRWEHEGQIYDEDGTLSGTLSSPGTTGIIVPSDGTVTDCPVEQQFSAGEFEGRKCPLETTKFIRFAFNNVLPESLEGKKVQFSLMNGGTVSDTEKTEVEYLKKRLTHPFGWMSQLRTSRTYDMEFLNAEAITNISYHGVFYSLKPTDCIVIAHSLTQKPDSFQIKGSGPNKEDELSSIPTCDDPTITFGQYYFDVNDKIVYYVVKGEPAATRKRRGLQSAYEHAENRQINFRVYRCHYEDCIPPPDANTIPPARTRPDAYSLWSEAGVWGQVDGVYTGTQIPETSSSEKKRSTPTSPVPFGDEVDIEIAKDSWIVMDVESTKAAPMRYRKITLKGTLEFEWNGGFEYFLSVTHIIVLGGRLIVGWPEEPLRGKATIELRGDTNTEDVLLDTGVNLGAKTIGGIGGVDLHGKDLSVVWTKLAATANAGDTTITLQQNVNGQWNIGDYIVIGTTSDDPWQNEQFEITGVNGAELTLNGSLAHRHYAETYTFNGQSFDIRAQVGLLTRNVRVVGEQSTSEADNFGGRVIIAEANGARGYGRFTNTEFHRCGQFGHTEGYDPRFALAYRNTAPVDTIRPSFVRKCSFHESYNTAVGVFLMRGLDDTSTGLEIENNVIYRTIGPGIRVEESKNTLLKDNLVMWMRALSGVFEDEPDLKFWHAAIEIQEATNTEMNGNEIAGSERAGVRTDGVDCAVEGVTCPVLPSPGLKPNIITGALQGLFMQKDDGHPLCSLLCNYQIHYAYDVGLHFQTATSRVIVENVIVTDSTNLLVPIIYAPSAEAHAMANKDVKIMNTLIVGHTEPDNCDITPSDRFYIQNSGLARAMLKPGGTRLMRMGLFFGLFNSGYNAAPGKPFYNQMTVAAINGQTIVEGVTFANFGEYCGGVSSAVATNLFGEDAIHPMTIKQTTFENVPEIAKVFFYYPSLGKINPSDCVDMECDGLKNSLLKDVDGTFTEYNEESSIIPQSEYQWNGDPRRGLGDDRIPKTALTSPTGDRLDVETLKHGIYREGCEFIAQWPGHKCKNIEHEIMVIESMDPDHITRRLSPIAFITNGYVDLVNGPQDHGWCHGYTCQERLSTFWTIVAMNQYYEIYMTGTAPKKMRMHYLNSDESQKMLVSLFMSSPTRKDVKVDGKYIPPNAEVPTTAAPVGSNHFDRFGGLMLTFVLYGNEIITIEQADVILLSITMEAIPVEDFYQTNVVNRLAAFLKIPEDKIKIIGITRAGTGRRKRATGDEMIIEIGNAPADDAPVSSTTANPQTAATTSSTNTDLSYDDLLVVESAVKLLLQTNMMNEVLNNTVLQLGTLLAPNGGEANPNNTEQVADAVQSVVIIRIATSLKIDHHPSNGYAGESLGEFKVFAVDKDNIKVVLGDSVNMWYIQAKISSPVGDVATLSGDVQSIDENGNALFNDLKISAEGQYVISFEVMTPADQSLDSPSSSVITISNLPSPVATTSRSVASTETTETKGVINTASSDATTSTADSSNPDISVTGTINESATSDDHSATETVNPATTTTSKPTGKPGNDGLSPTIVGVIAGVSVAGILILILAAYLIFKCKQDAQKITPDSSFTPKNGVYTTPPYTETSLKTEPNDYVVYSAPDHPHHVPPKEKPPGYEDIVNKPNV